MGNKIFGVVVFLLWGATMSWLLVAKILPPFFHGDPPRASHFSRMRPVAWTIELEGKPCGVSVSQAAEGALDTVEIHSRVRLDRIPLPEVAPQWMQSVLRNLGEVQLDIRNQATFDSLGALATFQTRVQVDEVQSVVKMSGRVHEGQLRLRIQAGEYVRRSQHAWTEKSMLGGELSPEPRLLRAYTGRKWREEVYSPFGAPGAPAELIEAEVLDEQLIRIGDELVSAKKVVYHSLTAAGVSEKDRLRAVVWVRDDGYVIRQDAYFMNVCLRFTRMTDDESKQLADELLELDRYVGVRTPDLPKSAAGAATDMPLQDGDDANHPPATPLRQRSPN